MTSTTARIARISSELEAARISRADAAVAIAAEAEHRGGREARRGDGAYFTDADVAQWLARRAIVAVLLESAGIAHERVDEMLAGGADLAAELVATLGSSPGARARVDNRLASIRVLDPTCGAGSFLVAALAALVEVRDAISSHAELDGAQLQGVDVDPGAVAACAALVQLELQAAGVAGSPSLHVGDAESDGALPAADVVIGNPPFVRARAEERHAGLATRPVGNRAAWIVERALHVAAPGARTAFVLPVSVACTSAFEPLRAVWSGSCSSAFAAHFDTVPASLFADAVQRVTLLEGRRRTDEPEPTRWHTTRYHRWLSAERAGLLERVRHVPLPTPTVEGSIAKVGTALEAELLDTVFAHPPAGRWIAPRAIEGAGVVRYKRRWSYFLLFTDFVPGLWDARGEAREPTELKTLHVRSGLDARVLLATFSSSLFWWYFSVFTDNRNVNRRDLEAFPLPELTDVDAAELVGLADELMAALHGCAELRTCTYRSVGTITNTYFRQGATRHVVDRIDRVLARAYGMDETQLAFVLGFERRFRS